MERCDREIDRLSRRAHWSRVATFIGLLASGAMLMWALIEVAILVAFYLGEAL
jgi:cytochrome b subunit of formate dehydrogenase